MPHTRAPRVCVSYILQLVAYEVCRRAADCAISHANGDLDWLKPYAIVGAGLIAGAAAAVASHPADLLLTRLCGSATPTSVAECVIGSGVLEQVQYLLSLGVGGMYAGLGPRLVMTSAMTSVQFSIYESVRHALGAGHGQQPTPGHSPRDECDGSGGTSGGESVQLASSPPPAAPPASLEAVRR